MNKKQSCVYNCDDLLSYNSSPRSSRISTVASRQKKDHFANFWVLAPKLAQTFLGLCRTDSEGVPRNRAFSREGRGGFVKVTRSLAMFSKSKGLSASVSFLPLSPPPTFIFWLLFHFSRGQNPRIPFLGLSLLRNQTETLATQPKNSEARQPW